MSCSQPTSSLEINDKTRGGGGEFVTFVDRAGNTAASPDIAATISTAQPSLIDFS